MIRAIRRAKLLIIAWLAASAALTIVQFRPPSVVFGDALYLTVGAGAMTVAWVGVARLRGGDRLVGSLLAAALTVFVAGDLTYLAIGWQAGTEPAASAADLAWIAGRIPLAAAALVLLRRGDGQRRPDIDGLIDVAAVFVAGMMVVGALAVSAALTVPSHPVMLQLLWGLYPVTCLAILALVLRLLLRDRTVFALLGTVAIAVCLASDIAYLAIGDPTYYPAPLSAGWLWAMILVALAVLIGPRRPLRWGHPRRQPVADQAGLGRISLALLPLLVPALIELQWFLSGNDPIPAITIPGTVLLVALAFARVGRLASSARQSRRALASRERFASTLAANSSDAVAVVDADLQIVNRCPNLATLVGRPLDAVYGSDLLSLVEPQDHETTRATVRRCLATPGQAFHLELRMLHEHASERWMAARVLNLLPDPDVGGVLVTLHDISDRKRAEEELSRQAFHDALTGLANRALFRDRLNHSLERCARTGTPPAVIFLDLDGFKTVNDRFGHDLGDTMLREVAARLTTAAGRGDTVGRLGGDEFAVLIEQSEHPLADAATTAARVQRTLRQPVRLGDHTVIPSASLGIAVGNRLGNGDLLRDADVAMYRSKAKGKDRWTLYRPGMRTAARERLEQETAMRLALERDEYRLVYQPMLELETKSVFGVEALLRWQHPTRGLLLPEHFIPLAEETGLIVPIGRWVLQEAIRTASQWRHEISNSPDFSLAVNLSARQLADQNLVSDVAEAVHNAHLNHGSLILETTETALVEDTSTAAARLQRLHALGVRLAIDDFGTGYSALSYLRHFPVDILKVDRGFVHSIPESGQFPPIVRGLLELARTLRIRTLAEGVERDFQRDRLREEHCDLAQGYLLARPMSATQTRHYLQRTAVNRA